VNLFKSLKKKPEPTVSNRTNIIQYDEMGYPLRLIWMSDGTKRWLDTDEEAGDTVLRRTIEYIPLNELIEDTESKHTEEKQLIKLNEHKYLLCKKTFMYGSSTLFIKGECYPIEYIGNKYYIKDKAGTQWNQDWYDKLLYKAFEPEVTEDIKIPINTVLNRISLSSDMDELEDWLKAYREGYHDCREEQE
jgi:hypothetical protein